MKKGNLEDNIKKLFENYQPSPPEHLWEEIDNKLGNNRKVRLGYALLYAAAITLLFAFSWTGYWIYNNLQTADEALAESVFEKPESFDIRPMEPIAGSEKTGEETYLEKQQLEAGKEKIAVLEISPEREKRTKPETITAFKEKPVEYDKDHQYIVYESVKLDYIDNIAAQTVKNTKISKESIYVSGLFASSDNDIEAIRGNRWSFGIKAAPQYAYRVNSSDPDILDQGKRAFEQNESYLITFNLGLKASYKINDKLYLESGLYYNRMGQSIRNIQVYNNKTPFGNYKGSKNPQSLLTSMGEISFDDPTLSFEDDRSDRITIIEGVKEPDSKLPVEGNRINQNIDFIELPLIIRYDLVNKNTKLQLKGGVGFNYMVLNNVVLEKGNNKEIIGTTSLIRNWNMSVSGGVAFLIPLTNNIDFHIEPTANVFITSMTKGREYNVYPFGLTMFTGISVSL